MIEERINQDLKQALLTGDKFTANALRTLKSVILYAKVAGGSPREEPLAESLLLGLLQKEAKKRQESADLYQQGGGEERAENELKEKHLIERYMPRVLNELEVAVLVDRAIDELGGASRTSIGAVIKKVRSECTGLLDGAILARLTREKLEL